MQTTPTHQETRSPGATRRRGPPASRPDPSARRTNEEVESPPREAVLALIRRQVLYLGLGVAAVNLVFPVVLAMRAWILDVPYWQMLIGEGNAITWFSSVQLLMVGAMAWANYLVLGLLRPTGHADRSSRRWVWAVLGVGFVFLSLDERFEIHERIRDGFLVQNGALSGIPFMEPGDVVLLVYMAVGLGLAAAIFAEFRRNRAALVLFGTGVLIAAAATLLDAFPGEPDPLSPWRAGLEEIGEIWAQLFFLLGFAALLRERLRWLRTSFVGGSDARRP